ncbi:MAG: hypothetical protein AB7V32_03875 [Candidatus Berkiella sp.]
MSLATAQESLSGVNTSLNKLFMQSTPSMVAKMFKQALVKHPLLKKEVVGFSEFEAGRYTDQSSLNLSTLLQERFWRSADPQIKSALDDISSSEMVDKTKVVEWLLLKYLNINSLSDPLTSSTQTNANKASPHPDSTDFQLHQLFYEPSRLFGITPENHKYHGISSTMWPWHPHDKMADSAPVFRKVIQVYILSYIIDELSYPNCADELLHNKVHVAKLKYKYHLLMQELLLEIQKLFNATTKPINIFEQGFNLLLAEIKPWRPLFSSFFLKNLLTSTVVLSAGLIFTNLLLPNLVPALAIKQLIFSFEFLLYTIIMAPEQLFIACHDIASIIPDKAFRLLNDFVKYGFLKIDQKLGTSLSKSVPHNTTADNLSIPNLEAPLKVMPLICEAIKNEAQALFSQLGKLNQSFNLSEAEKLQIKTCLGQLSSDEASAQTLTDAIKQAKTILGNNVTAQEADLLRQLIHHLQTKQVVIDAKESVALRMQPKLGYQPSLTLLKALHDQEIIKADGTWNAPMSIPSSLQEKCKRIEGVRPMASSQA